MRAQTSPSRRPVRVAIIGTGNAANNHVKYYRATRGCQVVAGMDVVPGRAQAFCAQHDIPHACSSLEELFATVDCDAVSVVTPDAYHCPITLAALKAGKHVLCEKPLALNHADARRMALAAKRSGKVNMVNFSYRSWPALEHMRRLVQKGTLGELRHVEASYYQSWLSSNIWGDWREKPASLWRMSSEHGGTGVLGDVGVHILDFVTHPAGEIKELLCSLKTFNKAPGNRVGKYHLDANDTALIQVEFKNGAVGIVHTTRWASGHANRLFLKICGTKGAAELDSDVSTDSLRVCDGPRLHTAEWRTIKSPAVAQIHHRFIDAIRKDSPESATPDFARGAAIQKLLDGCFTSDAEKRFLKV